MYYNFELVNGRGNTAYGNAGGRNSTTEVHATG